MTDQNIARLYVAMDNIVVLAPLQRHQHTPKICVMLRIGKIGPLCLKLRPVRLL